MNAPSRPSSTKPTINSPRHPSKKGKKPKNPSLTRDAISIPQLKRLEQEFIEGALSEPEFVERFQRVIPGLNEPQLVELFLKIDANADGEVSWDEVTQYLFVHAADANELSNSSTDTLEDQLSKQRFVKGPNLHHRYNGKTNFNHRGPVVKIIYMDAGRGSYLTASMDGTVHSWDATTFLHRGCLIQRETPIHDIIMLPMSKKLVVAEAHSTISFHDINSGSEYTRISGVRLHQCTPTSMDVYWDDITKKELLIVGDDTGSVHTFGLHYKAWQIKDSSVGLHGTRIQKFEHVERGYLKRLHTDWISKIQFVEDLNAVVSCSMDGTVKVSDINDLMRDSKSYFEKKRKKTNRNGGVGGMGERSKFKSNPLVPDWPCKNCGTMVSSGVAGSTSGCLKCGINCIRYIFEQHQCGVTDFAWSESNRMMVSVGVERGPLVWNPFSKSTVTQLDAGHASIMAVTVDERRQRIISVDAANHIHVHSFKNYKALQNLHQRTEHDRGIESSSGSSSSSNVGGASSSNAPSSSVVDTSGDACRLADVLRIGAMFFRDSNTVGGSLITATTHLHKWNLSADITRGNRGPDAERSPIGCCLYNSSFHQVATAELDDQSSICIWDPSTGNIIARLANAHEGSAVTAMTFDSGERRLITGSHDGCELHVFNFGNRRLLSRLVKLPSGVVTSALGSIEDKIVGRQISLVGDTKYDEMTELTVAMNSTFDFINDSSRIDLVPSPSLQPSPKKKKARTHQQSSIRQQSMSMHHRLSMNQPTFKNSLRMRESTIPPSNSPQIMGSVLHRSLKAQYKSRDRTKRTMLEKREKISYRKQPRADRNIETNSEVTKILYIEVNSGGVHLQHFIATTGWDQQIYIFDDDSTCGRQESGSLIKGYLYAVPRQEQMYTKHRADITDLAYCDPCLASCSLDGYVRFWSLQNGEHLGVVDIGDPVNKLVPLVSYQTLIAASESNIVLISTVSPYVILHDLDLMDLCNCQMISVLEISMSDTHLIVGDLSGKVHVLRIGASSLDVIHSWSAHTDRILNATFIENAEQLDIYIITTSERAEILMWTIDGILVGNYGNQTQHVAWTLGMPSTYKESNQVVLGNNAQEKIEEQGKGTKETEKKVDTVVGVGKKMNSVPVTLKLAEATSRHLPNVGEVWVRAHRKLGPSLDTDDGNANSKDSKDSSTTTAKDRLHFEHSDMITVQRVGRDSVVGWDGNFVNEAKLRHCPLVEFNPKVQHCWRLEPTLSKLVGCVYFGSLNAEPDRSQNKCNLNDPYKVVCVCQQEILRSSRPPQAVVVVRDHAMNIRPLPGYSSSAESISVERVPSTRRRSLVEAMRDREFQVVVGNGNGMVGMEESSHGETIGVKGEVEEEEEEEEGSGEEGSGEERSGKGEDDAGDDEGGNETENRHETDATKEQMTRQTSYVKYGKPSKRTPQKPRYKFQRLWQSRLDDRRTYNPSKIKKTAYHLK